MDLNDVGHEVSYVVGLVVDSNKFYTARREVQVVMGIKAPRGQMLLFGLDHTIPKQNGLVAAHHQQGALAIRAFMEQHNDS